MAQNKILPWAQTSTANALSDADYAADVANGGSYADGVKTGQASSKQANKTWRQATAPGAGLGQFLVDNLNVDVTDADTPATFSTRIANAVLKLAQISPFNQSWATATGGYRKYAIVSDSSGNFWVSTADQNTTVPGADGAKWQSLFNGYITEATADNRYVRFLDDGVNWPVQYIGVNKSTSAPWFRSGPNYYMLQPAGDYATNSSLNSVNTNLQNQINNRVQKTGDTMTGTLTLVGEYGEASGYSWSEALTLINKYSGSTAQILCTTQYGVDTAVRLKSTWGNNNNTVLDLHQNGTITTTHGTVAFQSDLPLPAGMHCQIFTVAIPNPVPADGWLVNIPAGWSIHSYVTGCDTGANVYAVSAKVENSTQARIWAKFPTNGAMADGGTATISSFGYF